MQYQTKPETNRYVSVDIINNWGRSFYHLKSEDFSKIYNRIDARIIRLSAATVTSEARSKDHNTAFKF